MVLASFRKRQILQETGLSAIHPNFSHSGSGRTALKADCPDTTQSGPPVFPLVRTRLCSRLDTIGAADDNGHTIAQYHRIAPSFLHGLGIDRMRFMHADEAIGFQPLNDRLH